MPVVLDLEVAGLVGEQFPMAARAGQDVQLADSLEDARQQRGVRIDAREAAGSDVAQARNQDAPLPQRVQRPLESPELRRCAQLLDSASNRGCAHVVEADSGDGCLQIRDRDFRGVESG